MAAPYKEAVLATAGLVSLWPLDETEGTTAADALSGFSAEYKETPTLGQTSILPNGEGKAVKLNGTSQYVLVPDHEALRFADVFTFEGWLNPEAFGGDLWCSAHNGATPEIRAEEKFVMLEKEVALMVTATTKMTAGNGYHLVVTKNGATVKQYLNGVDVTGVVTNKTFASTASAWTIGKNGNRAEQFFKGKLQYPAVYNSALSKATVEAHYAAGSKSTKAFTQGRSGLYLPPSDIVVPR